MKKILIVCVAGVITSLVPSCSSNLVSREHRTLRKEILKIHEEQILDNLVSAYEGDTPLHLHYYNFQGKGTSGAKISAGYNDTDNFDRITETGIDLLEIDKDGYDVDVEGTVGSEMSVFANPATGNDASKIFNAYEKFVRNSDFVRASRFPRQGEFFKVIVKKISGRKYYYYVPRSSAGKWRQLVKETTWASHILEKKK